MSTNSPIADLARKRLADDAVFGRRSEQIQIATEGRTLILEGSVSSFYLKQLLQACLSNIQGVERIDNRVSVIWPSES